MMRQSAYTVTLTGEMGLNGVPPVEGLVLTLFLLLM